MSRPIKKRMLAVILACCLTAVFFWSSIFTGTHTFHSCTSCKCPICFELHAASDNLKQLANVFGALYIAVVMLCGLLCATAYHTVTRRHHTLITLKVELNN